jgi:hypothetical protein
LTLRLGYGLALDLGAGSFKRVYLYGAADPRILPR